MSVCLTDKANNLDKTIASLNRLKGFVNICCIESKIALFRLQTPGSNKHADIFSMCECLEKASAKTSFWTEIVIIHCNSFSQLQFEFHACLSENMILRCSQNFPFSKLSINRYVSYIFHRDLCLTCTNYLCRDCNTVYNT